MLREMLLVLITIGIYFGNAYANCPYKDICPGGGIIKQCEDSNKDGIFDDPACEYWANASGGFYVDRWSFAQCNCTSYVAYKLNDPPLIDCNSGEKKWRERK